MGVFEMRKRPLLVFPPALIEQRLLDGVSSRALRLAERDAELEHAPVLAVGMNAEIRRRESDAGRSAVHG
jgi:hypothetical protein